jgi:uncharacterized membrane protein
MKPPQHHGSEAETEENTPTADKAPRRKKSAEPTPVLVKAARDLFGDDQRGGSNPAAGAVAAAAFALALMFSPMNADAAMSGGRMGGSFSSPSPSRSMPSRGGYSGGYRSGYGGGGYGGGGYYGRPSVTIAPTISPFYSPFSPFAFPRPFFFGGPGVITYSRGPSILDLLVFGGISFVIFNAIRAASSGVGVADSLSSWTEAPVTALGTGTSVVQVTVALDVPNRDDRNSILNVLDRLAETSRTDSRVGIQNLTSQVALELLRRKSSIVSGSTRYKHFKDRTQAQRDFNSLSVKERGKFEQETVSKYGGVDYGQQQGGQSRGGGGGSGQATAAVVTIMMAIDGDATKVPSIGSIQDVEEALRKIASDAKVDSCLQSAEILWTPEDRSETLTMRDVIADYPSLRSV